ncbi:putative serine/threonine-protein kinase-like protein CCR3 [Carex rostrata]
MAPKSRWCGLRKPKVRVPRNPVGPIFPAMDNVRVFSFNELNDATNNFSLDEQRGVGGYGTVYHGQLPDGRHVAVKRGNTRIPDLEAVFQNEVHRQAKARHENVVSLIGYCTENNERICVFEYMENRDLKQLLQPPRNAIFNSWRLRIKVLHDVARGIEYLHQDCSPRVIHRDIKSANILLGENWVAKISDFGLAVIGPLGGQDRVDLASATGTAGYADPESYNTDNPFVSQLTDVYSFGVVMLEVVTGKSAYNSPNETSLATSAALKIAEGRLMEVLDKRLPVPVGFNMEAVENVARLAQRCVSPAAQRPNMSVVVIELGNALTRFDQQEPIAN